MSEEYSSPDISDDEDILNMLDEMDNFNSDEDDEPTEPIDPRQQVLEISRGFAERSIKRLFNLQTPDTPIFKDVPTEEHSIDFQREDDTYKLHLDIVPCDHAIDFGECKPQTVIQEIERVLFRSVADAYSSVIEGTSVQEAELRKEVQTATFYLNYNDQYRIGCVLDHVVEA
jgi:hypothetical protein